MLHITNGDSIANTLRESAVPGQKAAFREDLTSGPALPGLSTNEWLRLRADFLSQAYGGPVQECIDGLTKQLTVLESSDQHQETVLWFGQDMNCQIHLIYLLNWFAERRPAGAFKGTPNAKTLSLICIGEFPGVEHLICLGELNAEQLDSLFVTRHEITGNEFDLARQAWAAYSSNDPTPVEALIKRDTSALPFLKAALSLHLTRFPSSKNGLGLVENWALEQVRSDPKDAGALFARFAPTHPASGVTDTQFWRSLRQMSECAEPLLVMTGIRTDATFDPLQWHSSRIEITPLGLDVLQGQKDFVELNGIDIWLGGVHLQTGKNEWRLDGGTGKLIHTGA